MLRTRAGVADQRELGVGYLPRAAFTAQLPHALDHFERELAGSGPASREHAAVEIGGALAAQIEPTVFDEGAAFAFPAQTEHLERANDFERDRIVEREHIDIARCGTRLAEGALGGSLAEVAHVAIQRRVGIVALKEFHAAAEHANGLSRQVARSLGGGDHQRRATFVHDAAVEPMEGCGDPR